MKFLEDLEWERARKAFSLPFVFGSEYKANWVRSLDCWSYHPEFIRSLAESMWVGGAWRSLLLSHVVLGSERGWGY
jgi:hypothetical protein